MIIEYHTLHRQLQTTGQNPTIIFFGAREVFYELNDHYSKDDGKVPAIPKGKGTGLLDLSLNRTQLWKN